MRSICRTCGIYCRCLKSADVLPRKRRSRARLWLCTAWKRAKSLGTESAPIARDRGSVLRSLYEARRSKCCGELCSDEADSEDRESITAGPQIRCLVLHINLVPESDGAELKEGNVDDLRDIFRGQDDRSYTLVYREDDDCRN